MAGRGAGADTPAPGTAGGGGGGHGGRGGRAAWQQFSSDSYGSFTEPREFGKSSRVLLGLVSSGGGGVLPYIDDTGTCDRTGSLFGSIFHKQGIYFTGIVKDRVYFTAVSLIDRVLFRCYFLDMVSFRI